MDNFARHIERTLDEWADTPRTKPLLLRGARQVGKTHALRELGKRKFDDMAYVTLFNGDIRTMMSRVVSPSMLLDAIEAATGVRPKPKTTLVVIDEIQEEPGLFPLLKTFGDEFPDIHLAAAGSYLGLALHERLSFPVGAVRMLDMHPLSFMEFLRAVGDGRAADALERHETDLVDALAERFEQRYRQYCVVGGMPAAVAAFIEYGYVAARDVQNGLLKTYDLDFSKHPVAGVDVERIRMTYSTYIPDHLAQENNHRFVFSHIGKGARASMYEAAIQTIVDCGLAIRVPRTKIARNPLGIYADEAAFKLYMHDVGLLGAALGITARDVVATDTGLIEYQGAMTEQYVCQQLVAAGLTPYYWVSGDSKYEVDFVFDSDQGITPLEVKAGEGRKKASLSRCCETYGLHGFRTSMRGYDQQDWMDNIPLWAIGSAFLPYDINDFKPDGGADLGPLPPLGPFVRD